MTDFEQLNNHGEQAEKPRPTESAVTQELTRANMLGNIEEKVVSAYESGDKKGGLALERARSVIEQGDGEVQVLAAAQRQIEMSLQPAEWTDEVRAAAVHINQEAQQEAGEAPLSFDEALSKLRGYQDSWKSGARRDGDEWLDNQANALGYSIRAAKRGDPEAVDSLLGVVEGMLGSTLGNSDEARDARGMRSLRDALFLQKQELDALAREDSPDQRLAKARERVAASAGGETKQPEDAARVPEGTAEADGTEETSDEAIDKEFRDRWIQVTGALRVTPTEIGINRDNLATLTNRQKLALTETFRRHYWERARGPASTSEEQLDKLRTAVKGIIG